MKRSTPSVPSHGPPFPPPPSLLTWMESLDPVTRYLFQCAGLTAWMWGAIIRTWNLGLPRSIEVIDRLLEYIRFGLNSGFCTYRPLSTPWPELAPKPKKMPKTR